MHNLYKQRYIISNDENKRVINSNEAVEEKLNELAKKIAKEAKKNGTDFVEGFTEGLGAEEVENILEEEPITEEITREEADAILEEARQEANRICKEADSQADAIAEHAREEGRKKGYEEGQIQAQTEYVEREKQLEVYKQQLLDDYSSKLEELEPQLLDVMIQVFEKVFHIQFDDKKEILMYLIQRAITNIEGSKEFNVRVSEDNYMFIESHKQEILSRVGENMIINITADSLLADNQCTIETDSGIFDCSLGVQLENLIKDLKSLCL